MKQYLFDYFLIIINHVSSILIGFLVMWILLNPIRMITTEISTRALLHMGIQNLATYLSLIIMFKKLGYSWNTPKDRLLPYDFIILSIFASFMIFLLIIITDYEFILLYYNTAWIVDMLFAENESLNTVGIVLIQSKYKPHTTLILLLHTISYIPPMLLGYYWGSKNRIEERRILTETNINN